MIVLVVGSGGREHALAWKIAQSPLVERVLAAPGSAGLSREALCFPDVGVSDADALIALCTREGVDLVVIGPEVPLAEGVADRLREAGIAVFGPSAAAAQLEGSKAFAKAFMARHGIPTASFEVFDEIERARDYVRGQDRACVVKADGLAAGKGVAVCGTREEALHALEEMMGDRRFGEAGAKVVIEELLEGEEASYYAITDGIHIATLAAAQDHKRALDGDRGENTGGMGAYCPAAVVSEAVEKRILEEVVHPAIRGMAEEGTPFCGVLYVGLMIDGTGQPKVIEFNVRFGDPETQALVVAMEGDLVPLLDGAARGDLDRRETVTCEDAAVCVVLASGGYPREFEKGIAIEGLDEMGSLPEATGTLSEATGTLTEATGTLTEATGTLTEATGTLTEATGTLSEATGTVVFHSGTVRKGDGFATSGGRVLGVTARGATVREARDRAYAAADRIRFDNLQMRSDIASRAL